MKHYVIVGASSGIGFELAKILSVNNQVTALSRTPGKLIELSGITHHEIDITNPDTPMPSLSTPVHGLVYCPGSIVLKPFRSLKDEDFLSDFQLNVLGAVKSVRHFLPLLQQAAPSSILLFSTVAVQTGMAFHASIAAAKGAVEGLVHSLAAEFAPGIRVNAIAPSLTDTPLAEKLLNAEAKVKAATERHPLKRIGNAIELASAAQFILESEWMTSQILTLDGGISRIR